MKLIKFYTSWCGPCKTLSLLLKQVDLSGVELVEIDAEEAPETAERYGVQSVPVLVLEVNGVEVERINGIAPPEVIQDMLNRR